MRLLSNSFIGGEISPGLFGRTDMQVYFQSAKEIKNFIIEKTGGLRKRYGTQFLWAVNGGKSLRTFRVIPIFYDINTYVAVAFYVHTGSTTICYRVLTPDDGVVSEEFSVPIAQINTDKDLFDYKIKQIGDTIFFSCSGSRSFIGRFDYEEIGTRDVLKWEEFSDTISVADAPEITGVAEGFESNSEQGFRPAVRKYALFGVKNGVFSKPSKVDIDIYLYWVAGATVTLKFTPRWVDHDYYVIAQQTGGTWGMMQTFYPDLSEGAQSDGTWADDGSSTVGSIVFNETEYIVDGSVGGLSDSADATLKGSYTDASGAVVEYEYSKNAIAVTSEVREEDGTITTPGYITAVYKDALSPVLGIRVWFGATLRKKNDDGEVDNVGATGKTRIQMYAVRIVDGKEVEDENPVATWNVNAIWNNQPQQLSVDDPVAGEEGIKYRLHFRNEHGTPVIVRGITLLSDTSTQEYVDNNINPGSITGTQDALTVGDSGMDCGIIDVWEQRLVMASSPEKPFSIWFSQAGDVMNFYTNRPMTDSDAFSVTIPVTVASRILHILTSRWMILFTESGEYSCDAAGNAGFAYSTITIRKTSSVGAHEGIEPVATEDKAVFVASDAKSVYEIAYSLEQDNIIPHNRSILASHLTEGRDIKKIVYKRFPDPELLCLMSDGTINAMTYIPSQEVFAWHRYEFANKRLKCVDISQTGTVGGKDGEHETSSVILLTFVDESNPTKFYIERLRWASIGDSPEEGDAKCCDHCGYPKEEFVGGSDPETPVEARIVTNMIDIPNNSIIGYKKNIYDCVLRMNRSGNVTVKPYYTDGSESESAKTSLWNSVEITNGKVGLLTKDVKILPRAYHNTNGQMVIESADKWACQILSILFNLDIQGSE